MRACIVGFGLSGRIFHKPLLEAAGVEVTKIALRDPSAPPQIDGLQFIDFKQACADSEIDLIVITSPNALHCEQAIAAIEAGKHVVIEKPLALSVDQADAIIEVAQKSDKILSVFHSRRWDGDFLTLRKLLHDGALGDWQIFKSHWGMNKVNAQTRWKDKAAAGGGLLIDFMPHLVDQALCLFGFPDEAFIEQSTQRKGSEAPDFIEITMRYGAKRVVLSVDCFTFRDFERFRLAGTKAEFVCTGTDPQENALREGISPLEPTFGSSNNRNSELRFVDGPIRALPLMSGHYLQFYQQFITAVKSQGVCPVSLQNARDVLRCLCSLQSNREWKLQS